MKRRTAKTKHDGRSGQERVLLRHFNHDSATLLLALTALLSLALHALGQDQPQPVPKMVSVDVAKPLTQPLQYRFNGKGPQAETELDIKGDGQNWRFVYFEKLPENTALKVKGAPAGYQDSEPLQPERWYPFRTYLPVVLEIKPDAHAPVVVGFWFGGPNTNGDEALLKTLRPEEVRQYADIREIRVISPDRQALTFSWGAASESPGATTPAATTTPTVSPTPTPTSWTDYLRDNPIITVLIVFGILAIIVSLMLYIVGKRAGDLADESHKEEKRPASAKAEQKRAPASDDTAAVRNIMDELGGVPSATTPVADTTARATNEAERAQPKTRTWGVRDDEQAKEQRSPFADSDRRPRPGDVVLPPSKSTPEQPVARTTQPFSSSMPVSSQDGERMQKLEADVSRLSLALEQKLERNEGLSVAAQAEVGSILAQVEHKLNEGLSQLRKQADDDLRRMLVTMAEKVGEANGRLIVDWEDKLKQTDNTLRRHLAEAVKSMKELVTEQASLMERKRGEINSQMNQVAGGGEKVKQQLEVLLKAQAQAERRLQTRLDQLQEMLGQQAAPESFYARTLGAILGKNVAELQDGNFERLMGERLNQFFQTEVGGDGLQELRTRAEGISAALKDVAGQMEKLNPQAAEAARPHLQRAATVAAELSGLQTQLQNQRVTIETTLRIPVSTHAGARQTFLDELGHGLRREIDKLSDPQSYFEGDLERLITIDLITIVDICDKKITPPGTYPELEGALKQLFKQAGLRYILPRPGEPFKTAEQDLIEIARDGVGKSLTIAQVLTRGFYHKQRDHETLLRKAGVTVYW